MLLSLLSFYTKITVSPVAKLRPTSLDQVDQAKNISAQGSLQMKGNLDTLASLKTSLAKVSTARPYRSLS
jgi:hypothetical protein